MRASIEGVSAHTGSPHLGKNALVAGGKVICALSELAKQYETLHTDCSKHFSDVAKFPVLSVATAQSGTAINVVPDSFEIGLGMRLLPDQNQNCCSKSQTGYVPGPPGCSTGIRCGNRSGVNRRPGFPKK